MLRCVAASATVAVLCFSTPSGAQPGKEIALIGGSKSHGVGEHDFPHGITLLKEFLDSSPDLRGARVIAFPDGWPRDPTVLEGASTLVLYFDGLESNPLSDSTQHAQFERLMKRGIGIIAFHQASTVPRGDHQINIAEWLGGARYGMFDRTEELVEFTPSQHPIGNGVGKFTLYDEFYPTISFLRNGGKRTPILTGKLHPQYREGKSLIIDKAEIHTVAWAFERADGGRAFTFTGLHYLAGLDNAALRRLLLNAIFWTAKIEIPKGGVRTTAPSDAAKQLISQDLETANGPKRTMTSAVVTRAARNQVVHYPWGHITWYASRELKNSDTMTIGEAVIKAGSENPSHFHPNCDEVLHVLEGHILSTTDNESVEMREGDTISIPAGIRHHLKNIGNDDAVVSLSFSSADRKVVGEQVAVGSL